MRSQEMFNLMQSGKEIRVALETDGDRIGGLLNEQHPLPEVEGEPVFDYRRHMQHLVAQLTSSVDRAVEAEDAHANSLIQVSRLKGERDTNANASYDKLVSVRQGLESLYQSGGFEMANVSGETPRVPDKLLKQMSQTVKLLKQPAVEVRNLKVKGFNVDLDEVADDLGAGIPDLRASISSLDGARKTAEGTLVTKQEATKELRRTVLWVGRTTEGLFYLADEDELAKRIRSSTRRPRRPLDTATAESPAEEAGSAPAEGTGSGDEPASEPQAPATSAEA